MDGYKEAFAIELQIDKLLRDNPIDTENYLDWMRFSRTITSGMRIIDKEASEVLKSI